MSRPPRALPNDRPAARNSGRAVAAVAKPARRRFRLLGWAITGLIWGGLALAAIGLWFARDLPRPQAALDAARRPSLTLQDRSGQILATFGDVVGDPLRLRTCPPTCRPPPSRSRTGASGAIPAST